MQVDIKLTAVQTIEWRLTRIRPRRDHNSSIMFFNLHLQARDYIVRNEERSHPALCWTLGSRVGHSRNPRRSDVEFSDVAMREQWILGISQDNMSSSTTGASGTSSGQRATGNCGIICTGRRRGSARELFYVIEDGSRNGNSDIVPDLSSIFMIIGDREN